MQVFGCLDNYSSVPVAYTYTDAHPLQDKNYYRLKITDKDGSITYSIIILVNTNTSGDALIYPNPVTGGDITVQLPAAESRKIRVFNATGGLVFVTTALPGSSVLINTDAWAKYLPREHPEE